MIFGSLCLCTLACFVLCRLASLQFDFALSCVNLCVCTLASPCLVSTCVFALWLRSLLCQLVCLHFGFALLTWLFAQLLTSKLPLL